VTSDQITAVYRDICLRLGDIDVKVQGLKNQRKQLFAELAVLDDKAKEAQEKTQQSQETEDAKRKEQNISAKGVPVS